MKKDETKHRAKLSKIEYPDDWQSLDDYSSHKPLLYLALKNTEGLVVEFGCGYGSTPMIRSYCEMTGREFISLETDKEWAAKFAGTEVIDSYENFVNNEIGLLFIDGKPGEERKERLQQFAPLAQVLLAHDTQQSADYCYGMSGILSTFKYRLDFVPEGLPETTAVSNFIDVTKWK